MSFSPAESDAVSATLRTLVAREGDVAPPYDFAEFRRRAAARPHDGTAPAVERTLRVAAMVAPLALLLTIVGVDRGRPVTDEAAQSAGAPAGGASVTEPALVQVGAAGRVHDLEDRIALLDTLLSEAPIAGLSDADRAELRSGRETLAHSLQRVRYAQTLLAY